MAEALKFKNLIEEDFSATLAGHVCFSCSLLLVVVDCQGAFCFVCLFVFSQGDGRLRCVTYQHCRIQDIYQSDSLQDEWPGMLLGNSWALAITWLLSLVSQMRSVCVCVCVLGGGGGGGGWVCHAFCNSKAFVLGQSEATSNGLRSQSTDTIVSQFLHELFLQQHHFMCIL